MLRVYNEGAKRLKATEKRRNARNETSGRDSRREIVRFLPSTTRALLGTLNLPL